MTQKNLFQFLHCRRDSWQGGRWGGRVGGKVESGKSAFAAMITSESKSQLRTLRRQKHWVFCWGFDSKQLAGVTVINLNVPQTHTHTHRQTERQTRRQACGQTVAKGRTNATPTFVSSRGAAAAPYTYECRGVSVSVYACVCVYLCVRARDLCPHDCVRVGFCLLKRQLSLTSWWQIDFLSLCGLLWPLACVSVCVCVRDKLAPP